MVKENELAEGMGCWKAACDAVNDAICIVDLEGKVLDCNKPMLAFLGKPREQVISRNCCELVRNSVKLFKDYPFLRAKETLKREIGVLENNGRIFEVIFEPIIDNDGKISSMAQIISDSQKQKRDDQQSRDSQVKLFQSAKMGSIGQLAGGVAHELNNPLVGILNNVQLVSLMLENKSALTPESLLPILKDMEASAKRCVDITQSLLNFSHIFKDNFQKISLTEIAEEVVTLVESELKLQNIIINTELTPGLPFIFGDIQLLEQAVFDIINNAKWAINKKGLEGGSITLKTGFETDKNSVFVSISDTGIGIPREIRERIFEPFFTTKEPGEGVGLGLSMAYNIFKLHQAGVDVESQEGAGALFKISFPVAV